MKHLAFLVIETRNEYGASDWSQVYQIVNADVRKELVKGMQVGDIVNLKNTPYPLRVMAVGTQQLTHNLEETRVTCEQVYQLPSGMYVALSAILWDSHE